MQLTDEVAVLQFPLHAFAIDFRRNVTLLRLHDGRLVIHSTAPFDTEDVKAIDAFGEPGWLVEATRMHDTFAKAGHAAFPGLPYLAPKNFRPGHGITTLPLQPPPGDWRGEIEVLEIDGLPWTNEHAFFHRASGTLVLADLLFHFDPASAGWARFFVRQVMRLPRLVGLSIFFRALIRDRAAFAGSLSRILAWDFQRLVVAHASPVLEDARTVFEDALREQGLWE